MLELIIAAILSTWVAAASLIPPGLRHSQAVAQAARARPIE